MGIQFRIEMRNPYNLKNSSRALRSPSQLLDQIGRYRNNAFFLSIERGREATGKPVKPLSKKYARYKYKKYGKQPIRVATGKMVKAYRQRKYNNRLIETIDSPYAIYHQTGTRKMPKRQLLPTGLEDMPQYGRKEIFRITRDYFRSVVAGTKIKR